MEQRIGPVVMHVTMEMEDGWEEDINTWYDTEHIPEILAVPGFLSVRRFVRVFGPETRLPSKYLCIYEMANEQVVEGRPYVTYHQGWRRELATTVASRDSQIDRFYTPWTERASQHYRTQRSVRKQIFPVHRSYTDHSGVAGNAPEPMIGASLEDNWSQPIGKAVLHNLFTPEPEWEKDILDWHDNEQIPTLLSCPGFLSGRRFMLTYDIARGGPSVIGHYKHLIVFQVEDDSVFESAAYLSAKERLEVSRKQIPGITLGVESGYRQVFPESGPFEFYRGPKALVGE